MKRINDRIFCFRTSLTNSFLVRLIDGYLLVDTGYQDRYERFLKQLKAAEIDLQEISYLLLTHHHNDHSGFARRLLLNCQAKLMVHRNAVPFLTTGTHDSRGEHWNKWIHQLITPLSKTEGHKFPPLNIRKDDIILQDDNPRTLTDLGIPGKLLYTPGHSADSISIIFDDGNAMVGDAAMNLLGLGAAKYRPFFVQDGNEILRSWKRLIRFGARTIYPSHGRPFSAAKLITHL